MRPKSACSVRPRLGSRSPRPRSALGLRFHENAQWSAGPEVAIERDKERTRRQAPVQQYHRCLRLLGLGTMFDEPKDVGNGPNVKGVEARVQTFLGRRTVSQDDVRDAVLKEMDRSLSGCDAAYDNAVLRRVLAKAVYEEWYFNKLETARERRRQQCLQKKTAQWQQVRVKRERYEKSQEKFTEWIKNKNEKMKKEQQLQNKSGRGANRSDVTGDMLPYNMWKEKKDKVLKRYITEENRRKRLQEEEETKLEERRAEAEKAFETWKRSADEKLKAKLHERERRQKEEKDKASTETEEKQRNADAAFACWRRKKDAERARKIKEQREKEEAAAAVRKSLLVSRRESSQQAFLHWLDSLNY